jgi:hypothetical protein
MHLLALYGAESLEFEMFAAFMSFLQSFIDVHDEERAVSRQLQRHVTALYSVLLKEQQKRERMSKHISLQTLSIDTNSFFLTLSFPVFVSRVEDFHELRRDVEEFLILQQPFYHMHMPDKSKIEVSSIRFREFEIVNLYFLLSDSGMVK